jgi:glycerate kinase
MKILVAPDKFKGSLTARDAAEAIALGLSEVLREAEIRMLPVADGGEGTAEAICGALDGQWVSLAVRNPIGEQIDARYAWIARDSTAVIEMSESAGLRRVAQQKRDPLRSSTFGVGEMIRDAVRRGAKKIIAGLGGSATNDGGIGMAAALGFEFLTSDGEALDAIPANLLALTRITAPESGEWLRLATEKDQMDAGVTIIAACDVRNPLLGERGATRVYGPQKGADTKTIEILEHGLKNLAAVVAQEFGVDFRDTPGAGAAGGLGFGLMSFCGATIRPGFEVVAEVLNLENAIAASDLVITGEGRLDAQTLEGKAAAGVAALARRHNKPVIAIAGSIEDRARLAGLFDATNSLVRDGITLADSMQEPAVHLQACASRVAREL